MGIIFVNKNPTIMNSGYPGGCATPKEQLVKQSSPESPLATVGKAVLMYTANTKKPRTSATITPCFISFSFSTSL